MFDEFIERKITIACIVSTEFWHTLSNNWTSGLLAADSAKLITTWCKEYYDKYGKAPGRGIELIYTEKLKKGVDKDKAGMIDSLLSGLSEEAEEIVQLDLPLLVDETKRYFKYRALKVLAEDIQFELDKGNLPLAEELYTKFSLPIEAKHTCIDPFGKDVKEMLEKAFSERQESIIKFPKALGTFWNSEMVRGGFIALMGAEKRGKSMLLIELAMRAVKSDSNVAFFQAGDMTELQQLRRMAIYLAGKSDEPRYCNGQWVPDRDCILHQLDECNKDCRQEGDRIFKNEKEINFESLVHAGKKYPEHTPCHNCSEIKGAPWLRWFPGHQPLTAAQAYKALRKFKMKHSGNFRLSTHANGTLSTKVIKHLLSEWERQEEFIADVIVVDYADLLIPESSKMDFRHQQNQIWQSLRNLSQEKNALVVTVTQIAARGYSKALLSLDDFSEDKRKFSHVTAMYGLNQTPEEKRIGTMRINELVVREADFDSTRPVTILQRLQIGKPFLGSWR